MLIVQLQSKDHIEIEVKMDELDLTAAEKKGNLRGNQSVCSGT